MKVQADSLGDANEYPSLPYIAEECSKLDKYKSNRVCSYINRLNTAKKEVFPLIKGNAYLVKLVYEDYYFVRLNSVAYTDVLLDGLRDFTKRVFYELNKETSKCNAVRVKEKAERKALMEAYGWREVSDGVWAGKPY